MFRTYVNSYAKINLGLRILKKRNDGFHDLETIFYPVKLHDEISIEISRLNNDYNSVVLKFNKPFIPLTKENLCYKAIEYFFREFRIKECYKISLNIVKNIPVGGGLGGGSSNAAAILKFLLKYLEIDIVSNRKRILQLALMIGSDVPFFLMMKPCYADGRGEKMQLLNNFKLNSDILIVNPNLHISTKWAFEKLNFKKDVVKIAQLGDVREFEKNNTGMFENEFEEVVFRKYNELRIIKEEMIQMGAIYSSMSGTGATMFGLFERHKKDDIRKCKEYYSLKKYFTYVSD